MLPKPVFQVLLTLLIGFVGAGTAWIAHFPAPFLTGPAIAVTVAGLMGLELTIAIRLRDLVFIGLGVTLGQTVTPEVIEAALRWPITLACLAVLLVAIIEFTMLMLTRFWNMDKTTALLAASPGHLSYVLGLTEGVRADISTVSVIQSIRVLSLTLLVPMFISIAGAAPQVKQLSPAVIALGSLTGVLLLAAALGWALKKARLPAAYLMGGLLVSAILHGTGMISGNVPQWLAVACFVVLGCLIGTRFSGVTWIELRVSLGAGLAVTALGVLLAGLFAALASWLTGFDFITLMMAFAPGGIETMTAMSVLLGIDPTFVAAHHVSRLLLLTLIVPMFVLRRQRS